MKNKYVALMAEYFPDIECYSTGPMYSDVVHVLGDPLPSQIILDAKYFDWYRQEKTIMCDNDAREQHIIAQELVVGTVSPVQTLIYEQKYKQAVRYLALKAQYDLDIANSVVPVPDAPVVPDIVQKEVDQTGEAAIDLINTIIYNGELVWYVLEPVIGDIEGLRRKYNFAINGAIDSEAVINSVAYPVWPDVRALLTAMGMA